MIKTLRLISTYLTEEVFVKSGPSYHFRIEIFQSCLDKTFSVCVFRRECFRVQPTFPQEGGKPSLENADEDFWVLDLGIIPPNYFAETEETCLNYVKCKLSEMFILS